MRKEDLTVREPIKKWPVTERPREILLEKGPEHVSDAGLIAILLRTGVSGKDVVQLARELLRQFHGIGGLLNAQKSELEKIKGLGPAKISQLMAALELTKRQLKECLKGKEINTFNDPEDLFSYLISSLGNLKNEVFKILYLNAGNQLIADEVLLKGSLNEAAVYPREAARKSLERNAYAVIFAHNHPSGLLQATDQDINITGKLITALKTVDVKVLDHIIIAGNNCLSMRQKNMVKF